MKDTAPLLNRNIHNTWRSKWGMSAIIDESQKIKTRAYLENYDKIFPKRRKDPDIGKEEEIIEPE